MPAKLVIALVLVAALLALVGVAAFAYFDRQRSRQHEERMKRREMEHEERQQLFDDEDL